MRVNPEQAELEDLEQSTRSCADDDDVRLDRAVDPDAACALAQNGLPVGK